MAGYDPFTLLIAALAGLGCGFLNVVASSGSAVSLPPDAFGATITYDPAGHIGSAAQVTDIEFARNLPYQPMPNARRLARSGPSATGAWPGRMPVGSRSRRQHVAVAAYDRYEPDRPGFKRCGVIA